jgi:hypothetical protein
MKGLQEVLIWLRTTAPNQWTTFELYPRLRQMSTHYPLK